MERQTAVDVSRLRGHAMSTEVSPAKRKRQEKTRKAQETAWKAKNGPVTVRKVDPATLRKPPVTSRYATALVVGHCAWKIRGISDQA